MNDRDRRFVWAEGDVLVAGPDTKDFDESLHPRDDAGKFTISGGGLASDGEPIRVSRQIEGTQTFSKIVDAMKETGQQAIFPASDYTNPQSELAKFYDKLPGNQDPVLAMLAHEKGFDAPPQIASPSEVDRMVAAGAPDLWRGVARNGDQSGEEVARQFLHGDYYAGKGTYGNGVYFIQSNDNTPGARMGAAINFAGSYADGGGGVLHATLAPDAKIADYDTIDAEAKSHYDAVMAQSVGEHDPHDAAVRHVLYDVGRYAMAQGYDAISVNQYHQGNTMYVVLNRGKVIAEDKVYPSTDRHIPDSELKRRILGGSQ